MGKVRTVTEFFVDGCIDAMREGVCFGVDGFALFFHEGKFYIEEPMVCEGTDETSVEDIRARMIDWYKKNPELMIMDADYLDNREVAV